jgi:hypothetical protein
MRHRPKVDLWRPPGAEHTRHPSFYLVWAVCALPGYKSACPDKQAVKDVRLDVFTLTRAPHGCCVWSSGGPTMGSWRADS